MKDLIERLAEHVVKEREDREAAIASGGEVHPLYLLPPFPCCYANDQPMHVAAAWLYQCKLLAMQVFLFSSFKR